MSKTLRPWVVAVVATLAMTVSYLDRQTLAAIAPTVRDELSISHARFGWLGSGFAVAYLVFAPISGRIVDRVGPKRALGVAVVLWSIVSAAHAFASTFAALFVLRVLLGVLEAPSFPAAARTIRTTLPANRRSAAMGLLFTGSSFGAMIAAPFAVHVAHVYGFRYAFVATAAAGLLWLPAWLLVAPSDRSDPEPKTDANDAVRASTGPAMPPLSIAFHPAVVRQAFVVLGSAPALLVVMHWYPQFLVEGCAVKKEAVGHYLWLPPLVFDVAAIGFGIAASLRDKGTDADGAPSAHHGLLAVAALLTATLVVVPFVHGAWPRVALGSLTMAGGAGMYVLGTADMLKRVPARDAALAGGLSAGVQSVVHIVANPIMGLWLDRTHDWTFVMAIGLVALPCAAAWSWLPRGRLGERHPPTADAAD